MALVAKNPPANTGDSRDPGSIPGCGRSPGEESYGQRSPAGYSPWGHKESDTTERARTQARVFHPIEQCIL